MGRKATSYSITGRYINKDDLRSVVGYRIQSQSDSSSVTVTIEQLAFLIGRGQITNCDAQIYKDRILFKGIGIKLDELPSAKVSVNKKVQKADGEQKNIENTTTRAPSNTATRAPSNTTTRAPSNTTTRAPSNTATRAPSNTATRAPSNTTVSTTGAPVSTKAGAKTSEKIRVYEELVNKAVEIFGIDRNKSREKQDSAGDGRYAVNKFVGSSKVNQNTGSTFIIQIAFTGYIDYGKHRLDVAIHEYTKDKAQNVIFKRRTENVRLKTIDEYVSVFNGIANNNQEALSNEKFAYILNNYYYKPAGLPNLEDYANSAMEEIEGNLGIQSFYDEVFKRLDKYYSNAKNREVAARSCSDDIKDTYINIDKVVGEMLYVSINKWGFGPESTEPGSREKLKVHVKFFDKIRGTFRSRVTRNLINANTVEYKRVEYYQLALRLRAFSHIADI